MYAVARRKVLSRSLRLIALYTAAFVLLAGTALAASGDLDASFGTGGKARTDLGTGEEFATALAIQSDGKILLTGQAGGSQIALQRYTTAGVLDDTFTGSTRTIRDSVDNTLTPEVHAVVVQSDGKILQVGSAQTSGGTRNIMIVRSLADGTLDTRFARGGVLLTDIAGTLRDDQAFDAVIQPDGKIVVVGTTNDASLGDIFLIARYTARGRLEKAFGNSGTMRLDLAELGVSAGRDIAYGVALQPDGKIVVAGTTDSPVGAFSNTALVRLTSKGVLDATFGGDGVKLYDFGPDTEIKDVALQNGKIVVAGWITATGRSQLVARFAADGSLDTSFGTSGYSTYGPDTTNYEYYGRGLAVSSTRIAVAGWRWDKVSVEETLVTLYDSDGTLVPGWASSGVFIRNLGLDGFDSAAYNVAFDSSENILIAGYASTGGTGSDFSVARLLA